MNGTTGTISQNGVFRTGPGKAPRPVGPDVDAGRDADRGVGHRVSGGSGSHLTFADSLLRPAMIAACLLAVIAAWIASVLFKG